MKRPRAGPSSLGIMGLFGRKPQTMSEPLGEPEGPPLDRAEETRVALMLPEEEEEKEQEDLVECPLCLLAQPKAAFPALSSCAHLSCLACLQQYLRIEISESRVQLACPHCPALLQPAEIHQLLPEAGLRDKYEEYLLRRLLVADPGTRWCPAPDCSYAVIAYGCAECPRLVCGRQDCKTEFCYHCRQPWHPNSSCEQAWREWKQQSPLGAVELSTQLIWKEEAAHNPDTIKVCPRCGAFIMKINDGSCNRMNCTVCGCLFCWLCMQEITDVHFLSPSGCTFWGKKPWSRTRKLLWQLGMVLGAPMVISIVAGIAVPVITLGIPIYTGKKVLSHGRKSKLSGCQQCLSVASSILLSLFVSPVITAVTVVNELLAVLPNPMVPEKGASASIPHSSNSQHEEPCQKDRKSESASTVALAGSMLSEAQETSHRDGLNLVEVEVEIETQPQAAGEHSLCSAASGHSFSADSLAYTSDGCSLAGVMTE
ncbi:E3 ubiquitin-protein ligase RNF19A-like isoform X2 [Ahaetulla prasina]|uniref:E3 ubiquitin-protein ligase RNF19A-like isoform X2 n=1 Tax=Ahaetulla prasina TaxID=499056 RepID=UPI00264790B7|nr:E3 ubiquitin-protein ligase RNF19A-like isoform X2 [Ahaetulla prasina]